MPELPEVEAVCRKLASDAAGRRITSVRILRCARPAVMGARRRVVLRVDRRGKHILVRLSGGKTLATHLRMSGNLRVIPDGRLHSDQARAVLRLDNGSAIVLEDPRALAVMDLISGEEPAGIGVEPLSEEFTAGALEGMMNKSASPLKVFLMDQRKIAGIGNIYSAEILHRARIHPARKAASLGRARVELLHGTIVGALTDAVQSACIAYSGPGGFHTEETFPLAVYGKSGEACERCGARIRRIIQAGRSTYYCPGCQK
jgi:formamidopyrimidine-DNA glycosylase